MNSSSTTILAIGLGKFNSVLCWYEPAPGAAGAEDVRCALNRSDDATTDQEILSPSAVSLLTDRGHIWVR